MGQAASRQEAFWEACGYGHVNRVQAFLAAGDIDVNWISYTHNSCALHVASQGNPRIVEMLLKADCQVNIKDDRGNLPIHHAAMKGNVEIMEMLIHAGSQINIPDKNGWTALIKASYWCQPEAIRCLLKHKCDVTYTNKDDRTALHEACRSQCVDDEEGLAEIAKLLIDAGCDMNSKCSDIGEADFTPLMFASYHGHAKMARALVEKGCDIHAQGSNKWTALHWAADRGHREICEMLLSAGINPMVEGKRGELAMNRAKNNELRDLLEQAVISMRGSCDTDDEETEENCESAVMSNGKSTNGEKEVRVEKSSTPKTPKISEFLNFGHDDRSARMARRKARMQQRRKQLEHRHGHNMRPEDDDDTDSCTSPGSSIADVMDKDDTTEKIAHSINSIPFADNSDDDILCSNLQKSLDIKNDNESSSPNGESNGNELES